MTWGEEPWGNLSGPKAVLQIEGVVELSTAVDSRPIGAQADGSKGAISVEKTFPLDIER